MIDYRVIATGSKGNAALIDNRILIDCGVSFKKIQDIYKNLELVLLTHIHSDHFKHSTIRLLAQERPTLRFGCGKWLENDLERCEVKNIDIMEYGKLYDYGTVSVIPIKLYHNVPNCGFRLRINGEKVLYATDTCTLKGIKAPEYDLYMIEANYDSDKIHKSIHQKRESGQYAYEIDVLKNHMCISDSEAFFEENRGAGSQVVYLHGHDYGDD